MNSVMYLYQPIMTINSLPNEPNKKVEQYIFLVFFMSGLGSILGGTAAGKLCEKYSRIHVSYIMLLLAIVGNNFSIARLIYLVLL